MKLLVLSDLHLEFADMAVPADAAFDVAVLAGDIVCPGSKAMAWARRPSALQRAKAVLLVPGNHEYYDSVMPDELAAMQRSAERASNPPVHLLDCDASWSAVCAFWVVACGPTSSCASTPPKGRCPM